MKAKTIFLIILIIVITMHNTYATNEIIKSQFDELNICSLISEGKRYTSEVFPEINYEDYFSDIINGNINNKTIFMNIIKLLGKEIVSSVTLLGSILIIVVIHSILKNIGENLGNENVANIAYFVEYILIVTLITTNFYQVISMVKESISNLTGFMNTLLPILIALVSATRTSCYSNCDSTSTIDSSSINRKYS